MLGKSLSLAFPDNPYYWLGHRITDLSTAENCAVVVREPLYSIASWLDCNNDRREDAVERIVDWHIRYMKGVVKAKDNAIVFDLSDLSVNPFACTVAFSERFGFDKPNPFDVDEVSAWLTENMPAHFLRETSASKESRYEDVLSNHRYEESLEAYEQVLALTVKFD